MVKFLCCPHLLWKIAVFVHKSEGTDGAVPVVKANTVLYTFT